MSDARSKARGRTTKPERIIHLSRGRHSPGKGLLRLLQLSTAGHLVEQDVSTPVEGEGGGSGEGESVHLHAGPGILLLPGLFRRGSRHALPRGVGRVQQVPEIL